MEDKNLSQSLEDYLEAIYMLAGDKNFTHANKISESLQVSKSSVSWALKQLSDKGLIHYTPYEAITLTETGKTAAAALAGRHLEIKNFLTKVLSIDGAAAEANACRMEHVLDKAVLERMKDFLSFLNHCPQAGEQWLTRFARFCQQGSDTGRCTDCFGETLNRCSGTESAGREPGQPPATRVHYTVRHCKDILRECGRELNDTEVAVVHGFFQSSQHISAEQLYQHVRHEQPQATMKQVEKTMLLLCAHKIARMVRFQDKIVYELFQPHSHHDHLYCVKCGSIREFFDPRLEALQEDNARRASFRLLMHNLNIYGLCDGCIREQEQIRRLSDCHVGERLAVSQILADSQESRRLAEMGLVPGAAVEVLHAQGPNKSFLVMSGGSRMMLDTAAAEKILVEIAETDTDTAWGGPNRRRRHRHGRTEERETLTEPAPAEGPGCPATLTLDQLTPGVTARICRIEGSSPFKKRLLEMGLIRGELIQKVKLAPLADPAEYIVKNYHISLRAEEARAVTVAIVKG